MNCANCGRKLSKAIYHKGQPYGPKCAARLKPTRMQTIKARIKAFWQAQLDLFGGVS